ncbi:MAG TPA: hypothetical protein VD994_12365, partial [Prosthecobacter sp.]|nr:hypothetical protein [Prosthecobacter sp.]
TTVSQPSGGVTNPTEGGTDTVLIRLTKAPASASVIVDFASSSVGDVTVSPASMTFTTGNWSAAQTLTLTAVADMIPEGREPVTITATVRNTSDSTYLSAPAQAVPVWIAEQMRRNQSLVVVQTGGTSYVAEGGKTDTLLFYLASRPTAEVTVTIDTNTQLEVDGNLFTFTPANWNVPQTVNIKALDDMAVESNHTSNIQWRCNNPNGVLVPGDPLFTNSNPTTSINIVDNDGIGVLVEESGGDTTTVEGATNGSQSDTHTVRLSKAPDGNVVIAVASSNTTAGQTVSPASLTFNAANWNTPQTVTVTAFNDSSVEQFATGAIPYPNAHTSGTVTHTVTAGSTTDTTGYAALTGIQSVTNHITDDDNRIITAHTGLDTRVQEDGANSDTYTVVLRSAPSSQVTVTPAVTVNQGMAVAPASLVFNAGNWSTPQTVTVSGSFSASTPTRIHTSNITHTSSSSDANYNAQTIPNVQATIVTKDTPQIVVYETSSTTVLTEGGQTDTYQMALSQAPTSDVTVTLTPDAQVGIVGPTTLTFTSANWSMLQTVTVRAVDDLVAEENGHAGWVTHSATSSDAVFNNLAMAAVPCFITDNDFPAVRVVPSGGSTVLSEAGATDTYDVYLTRQPASDVTVTITGTAQATVAAPGTVLTFTNSNWAIPQTVTLAALNDAAVEGAHSTTITHACASADPDFSSLAAPSVVASITDNDGPQVVVTHSGGDTTVVEGGGADSFTIRLSQAPAGNVTITLVAPLYIIPVPPYAKQLGYYTSDVGGSNQQRDRIVLDYSELIVLYRETFYQTLETAYGGTGNMPLNPAELEVQKAHWAATKAIIDKMDLWWCGGSLKARFPTIAGPGDPPQAPQALANPRQVVMDCIYYMNGGNNNLGTKRYAPKVVFNPKAPPAGSFHDEVRDRARWAGYLMSTVMPAFVSH